MFIEFTRGSLLITLLFLIIPGFTYAVDGVMEINQTCAVQTGCFDGDTPGFPVTISDPGSYRLTGNLTVPDANTTAIKTRPTSISLDLNGFGIIGITFCNGSPANEDFECFNVGTGIGIDAEDARIRVRNGSIQGMGNIGISTSTGSIVEDLVFRGIGSVAIDVAPDSVVKDNLITLSGSGIEALNSNVIGNTVKYAGGLGIRANGMITDNLVEDVGQDGISSNGGLIRDNVVIRATGFALSGSLTSAYKGNVFNFNNGGNSEPQVSVGPQELGPNICGLDTTCP